MRLSKFLRCHEKVKILNINSHPCDHTSRRNELKRTERGTPCASPEPNFRLMLYRQNMVHPYFLKYFHRRKKCDFVLKIKQSLLSCTRGRLAYSTSASIIPPISYQNNLKVINLQGFPIKTPVCL